MKYLLTFASLVLGLQTAVAGPKVIYGGDNRIDIYQTNAATQTLARSTAGMIPVNQFVKGARANYFDLKQFRTLEAAQNVCATEKFSQQPVAPSCSGFLVGPDTLVTAGHCYNNQYYNQDVACKAFAWVFDYDMKSASHNPTKNIPMTNIYTCKQVLATKLDANWDFAIIKLDRPVVGRTPLKIRTSGKIADSTSLVVIGHPTGLPTKVAGGGKLTKNSEITRFSTTLDTFHGNSGSAVFNAQNGQVEGILIQGKTDYVPSIASNPKSCMVVNKCDDNGKKCSAGAKESGSVAHGEVVLRIEKIAHLITQALALKK